MKVLHTLLLSAGLAVGTASAADLLDWHKPVAKNINTLTAPVRVVNLWATWCKPCRKEMPAMSTWYKKQKRGSVDMVGIALDRTENIGAFLKQTPVSYPIWRYDGADSRGFMKSMGNIVGALPFTVVEAPKCGYKQTILGEVTAQKLDSETQKARTACSKK